MFTLGALVLWYLALAGMVGAVVLRPNLSMQALCVVYAAAAVSSGIGLWRQARWAPTSFLLWSSAALATLLLADIQLNRGPTVRGITFLIGAAIVLFAAHWYVRKRTQLLVTPP